MQEPRVYGRGRRYLAVLLLLLGLAGCLRSQQPPLFSPAEKRYIQEHGDSLEVLSGYEAPPNAYHDRDGSYKGLLVDYLREIEAVSGLKFRFRDFSTWDQLIEYAKKGRNFIVVGIANTPARSQYLKFTDPFIKVPYIIVSRISNPVTEIGQLESMSFCTVANYAVNDYLARYYPALRPGFVMDNLAGLRAVSDGRYDAMVLNQMYATWLIEHQGITNLRISGESGYLNRLSAAVSIHDPILYSIVEKTLDQIPKSTGRALYLKWLGQGDSLSSRRLAVGAVTVAGFCGLLLLAFWGWNISLQRQVKKRTSEIVASREQLQRSEAKFRSYIEKAPLGICLFEDVDRIVEANPSFTELAGESVHELRRRFLSDCIIEGEREKFKQAVNRAGKEGVASFLGYFVKGDGEQRYGMFNFAHLQDNQFLLFLDDITEQHRIEKEILKMQRLQSIGTLAGGIAHDFNNVLMGIFGNISFAREDLEAGHPAHDSLRLAEQSLNRATRLTRQLLTFSKGGEPVLADHNIAKLVEETAEFDLAGSPVRVHLVADDPNLLVSIDAGQIQQVLSNLFINAKQAMPDGGKLSVRISRVTLEETNRFALSAGDYVRISVQDTGTGIKPAHLPHIFDPYFSTKQTGFGLGLATVYSIVTRHQGYVDVTSQLGEGSCFTVYLPAVDGHGPGELPSDSEKQGRKGDLSRLLIMDDEQAILHLVTRMLEREGYRVDSCLDGREAVELFQEALESGNPYQVVILDLTVPGGMGGVETAEQLQRLDSAAKLVVSSGYSDDPVLADPGAYGFSGVIGKPYTKKQLLATLGKLYDDG